MTLFPSCARCFSYSCNTVGSPDNLPSPDCDLGVPSSGLNLDPQAGSPVAVTAQLLPTTHLSHNPPDPAVYHPVFSIALHSPPLYLRRPSFPGIAGIPHSQGHGPERGHVAPGLGRSRQVCWSPCSGACIRAFAYCALPSNHPPTHLYPHDPVEPQRALRAI